MNAIRVLLVDDHPVVRTGIRTMLERASDIQVVGEAPDGGEALHLADAIAADVMVLDMEMPGLVGPEVARRLRGAGSRLRVLALSAHDDEQYVLGLLECGASGYLTKDEACDDILAAVRGVARGEAGWLSRRAAACWTHRTAASAMETPDAPTVADATGEASVLSERERQVLRLLASGADNRRIADVLCLAAGTVKNHITHIYGRLGVDSRAQAVAWAWRHGFVDAG